MSTIEKDGQFNELNFGRILSLLYTRSGSSWLRKMNMTQHDMRTSIFSAFVTKIHVKYSLNSATQNTGLIIVHKYIIKHFHCDDDI